MWVVWPTIICLMFVCRCTHHRLLRASRPPQSKCIRLNLEKKNESHNRKKTRELMNQRQVKKLTVVTCSRPEIDDKRYRNRQQQPQKNIWCALRWFAAITLLIISNVIIINNERIDMNIIFYLWNANNQTKNKPLAITRQYAFEMREVSDRIARSHNLYS